MTHTHSLYTLCLDPGASLGKGLVSDFSLTWTLKIPKVKHSGEGSRAWSDLTVVASECSLSS